MDWSQFTLIDDEPSVSDVDWSQFTLIDPGFSNVEGEFLSDAPNVVHPSEIPAVPDPSAPRQDTPPVRQSLAGRLGESALRMIQPVAEGVRSVGVGAAGGLETVPAQARMAGAGLMQMGADMPRWMYPLSSRDEYDQIVSQQGQRAADLYGRASQEQQAIRERTLAEGGDPLLFDIASSAPTFAAGVAGSMVNPVVGMAAFSAPIAPQTYADSRIGEGLSPADAAARTGVHTAAEFIPSAVPARAIRRAGLMGRAPAAATVGAAEYVQEAGTDLLQQAYDAQTGLQEGVDLGQVAYSGLIGAGLGGPTGAMMGRSPNAEIQEQRARQAEARVDSILATGRTEADGGALVDAMMEQGAAELAATATAVTAPDIMPTPAPTPAQVQRHEQLLQAKQDGEAGIDAALDSLIAAAAEPAANTSTETEQASETVVPFSPEDQAVTTGQPPAPAGDLSVDLPPPVARETASGGIPYAALGLPEPKPRNRVRSREDFDPVHHDLLDWIALRGGLDRVAWESEGMDPALWRTRGAQQTNQRFFGMPVFRRDSGMTPDQLREAMQQAGWMQSDDPNAPPTSSANDALDMVTQAINQGELFRLPQGQEADLAIRAWERDTIEREQEAGMASDLGFASVEAMYDAASFAEWVDSQREQANEDRGSESRGPGAVSERVGSQASPGEDAGRSGFEVSEPQADDHRSGVAGQAQGFQLQPVERQRQADPVTDQQRVQGGLFAPPTRGEVIDAERRRRQDETDGRASTGRTDMMAGDGELFAGDRPRQADIEQARQGKETAVPLSSAEAESNVPEGAPSFSRRGWSPDFPEVAVAHRPGPVRDHPDYAAAKAGDDVAALRLARDVVTPEFVQSIRAQIPEGGRPKIVPVVAREASGNNRIPDAAAEVLAQSLGLEVDRGPTQAAKVSRGGSDAVHRLANQPPFDGPVEVGQDYIILDDTLTQGGTLAQLKTHIEDNGGRVVLASALTGKNYSRKIALDPGTLEQVRERFGSIEPWWNEQFGHGFDGLTESEARTILTLDKGRLSADALRDRVAASRVDGLRGMGEGAASDRPDTPAPGAAGRLTESTETPPDGGVSASEPSPSDPAVSAAIRRLDSGDIVMNQRGNYAIARTAPGQYTIAPFTGDGQKTRVDRAGVESFLNERNAPPADGPVESRRRTDQDGGREQAKPSGIPAGLPAERTAETRRLEGKLNAHLRTREGVGAQTRFRAVQQDSLPDAVSGALAALGEATGTRVVVVRNETPNLIRFNGVTTRDGVLYVDETAESPATTVASHEFTHQLQRDNPELYQRLQDEVERQGLLADFALELERRGEKNAMPIAAQELTADAVGDAMSDPAFLRRVAARNPGVFRQVADAFIEFLDKLMGRVRDLGSGQYLTDVQAFRDVLSDVLAEYRTPERDRQQGQAGGDLALSRLGESRDTTTPVATQDSVAGTQRDRAAGGETRRDSAVDESTGLPLNDDGTVTVYHHTSAESAAAIRDTGMLQARAEPDVYVTSRQEPDTGYGDAVVAIRVDPGRLQLDDEFPNGRRDFRLNVGRPGGSIKVSVQNDPGAPVGSGAPAFSRPRPSGTGAQQPARQHTTAQAAQGQPPPTLGGRLMQGILPNLPGNTGQRIANQIDDGFHRDWFDEFVDLARAEEATAERMGIDPKDLPEHLQARRAENLRHGAYQDKIQRAEDDYFRPVARILGEANLDREGLADYLWWRHAGERDAYLRQKDGTNAGPADLAGIDPKDAAANIAALPAETRQAYEHAAKYIDQLRRHTLDVLVDSGQITPEVRKSLTDRWQHYVPLRGLPAGSDPILASFTGGGGGRGLSQQRNPIGKQALGRKSKPSDRVPHACGDEPSMS